MTGNVKAPRAPLKPGGKTYLIMGNHASQCGKLTLLFIFRKLTFKKKPTYMSVGGSSDMFTHNP